jgi:hypothetical protein
MLLGLEENWDLERLEGEELVGFTGIELVFE